MTTKTPEKYREMVKKVSSSITYLRELGFIVKDESKEVICNPIDKKVHDLLIYLKSKGYKLKGG